MSEQGTDIGIQLAPNGTGQRSSLALGRETIAAALRAAGSPHADAALAEARWRKRYPQHIARLVQAGLASADAAYRVAEAGLGQLWRGMEWHEAGQSVPLESLRQRTLQAPVFDTLSVHGHGSAAPEPWSVPIGGRQLQGGALQSQIACWVDEGIIEPGAGQALLRCLAHPEWFDLSDRRIVLLGAGSEAGPLSWLMKWRAQVVAVDIPRAEVWRRVAAIAESGNGVVHIPVARSRAAGGDWAASAGADLLRAAPAVRDWVAGFDGALDIAAHGYADGERHLRLAVAMDLVQDLALQRPGSSLAWLATPTDVFAVPMAAAEAARQAWARRTPLRRSAEAAARLASGGHLFQPNIATPHETLGGGPYGVADCLIPEQGPNYALAKRMQQWRALLARRAGVRVSLNVAPSTLTGSVLKNRAFAAAFAGARAFGVQPFQPATTTALMAALWVHDLRCPDAAGNPARALAHPYELFMDAACHGGLWRCAYLPRSALPFAALLGALPGRGARAESI